MTPKDKAKQLVDKFTTVGLQQRNEGIQCALICVDEIVKNGFNTQMPYNYWESVKYEIQQL